jgi:hypothetical protein
MLWMALRWNWANTLPIAAFCLLSLLAIGGGRTAPEAVSPAASAQISAMAPLPTDPRQPAAAIALNVN